MERILSREETEKDRVGKTATRLYSPPKLSSFGPVSEITAGATGSVSEFVPPNICSNSQTKNSDPNCPPLP